MKKITISLFIFIFFLKGYGNINHIDISKISKDTSIINCYNYVNANQLYYEKWSSTWQYPLSKNKIVANLKRIYKELSDIPAKNEELYLLCGDVAHYLYNLDDEESYNLAIDNYNKAIRINSTDYRAYWFLGYHYSLSNMPIEAIKNFDLAEKNIPAKIPVDYWEEYATASFFAGMRYHCEMAIEKTRDILGHQGKFENEYGDFFSNKIVIPQSSLSYNKQELWQVEQDSLVNFLSFPLGIKYSIDSLWRVDLYDYKNNTTAITLLPKEIKNKSGKPTYYSIAIIMKVANKDDRFEDFINKLLSRNINATKKSIQLSDKYPNMVGYEISDKETYKNMGGGRFIILGIERNKPNTPGVILETPVIMQQNNGTMGYYSMQQKLTRFNENIFYAIILDSCGDIYADSYKVFKSFFNNQLMIE